MLRIYLLLSATAASCLTSYGNSTTPTRASFLASQTATRDETSDSNALGSYILQGLAGGFTTSTALVSRNPSSLLSSSIPSSQGSGSSKADTDVATLGVHPQSITVYSDYFTKSSTGSEFASAEKCWSDLVSWTSNSIEWWNSNMANRTITVTYTTTTDLLEVVTSTGLVTYYPSSVSTYKLCDGSPRANVRPYTSTWTTSSTAYGTTVTEVDYPTYPISQPCDPSPQQCEIWYEDSRAHELNQNVVENYCGMPPHGLDYSCIIGIRGAVQLIYFPASVSNRNNSLCGGNSSTISASPGNGGPSVITTLGHTFTSGSAYISVQALSAYNDAFQYQIGPNFTDLILTLASTDVSSECSGDQTATRMNFADLNWPVAASAYNCQDRCGFFQGVNRTTPECATIWEDVNPFLKIPDQVTDLHPLFKTCAPAPWYFSNAWFDPPIALQGQSVAATATQPTPAPTTPAAPVSTLLSPTPTSTIRATMTQGPSSSSSDTRPAAETGTFVPADGPAESVLPEADTTISDSDSSSSHLAPVSSTEHGLSSVFAASVASPSEVESSAVRTATTSYGSPLSTTEAVDPPLSNSDSAVVSAAQVGTQSQSAADSTAVVPAQSGVAFTAPDPTSEPQSAKISSSTPAAQVSAAQIPSGSSPPDTTPQFSFDPTSTAQDGAIITIASHAVTVVQSSGNLVIGASVVPAGEGATIDGQTIVQNSGAIIVGSSRVAVSQLPEASSAADPPVSTLVAGSITFIASAISANTGAVIVAGQTVSIGGQAATVSGHAITQGSSGLVIISGEHTQPLSALEAPTPSVLQVSSFTITASPVSGDPNVVQIGTNVLSAGGAAATVSGKIITQGSSGLVLLPGFSPRPTVLQQGSLTITASPVGGNPNVVAVDGHTLSAGGAAATISGKVISQGSSALLLLPSGAAATSGPQPTVLQDGSSFTVTASPVGGNPNVVAVDGHTLSQGGPAATISGKIISQGSSALIVLPAPHTTASGPQPTVLQDGTFTVTASPVGGNPNVVDVNGHTLSAGGAAATVSGKIISQDSSALVVLPAPATTSLPSVVVQTTSTSATYTPGVRTGSNPEATTSTRSAASRSEMWLSLYALAGMLLALWS